MAAGMVNTRARPSARPWVVVAGLVALIAGVNAFGGTPAPIDFTRHGTQPTLLRPLEASETCQGCHAGYLEEDRQFTPHSTWSGSMMANAARDPLFWAALDVANHDVPGVGDFCLRCHTPSGWFAGRVSKTGTGTVDGADGCLLRGDHDDADFVNTDYDGVNCHLCHRAMPEGPTGQTASLDNTNLWIDDSASCGIFFGPCRRGPYKYPDGNIGGSPPHGWQQSAFHLDSRLCGSCHDVTSPDLESGPFKTLILNNGMDSGSPFPIERTYSEWRASDFGDLMFTDGFAGNEPLATGAKAGASCQTCHMPISTDPMARACDQFPSGTRTNNLPTHQFVGGNTWVPNLIKNLYGGETGLDRAAAFDRTIAWAQNMLTQNSANLVVTLDPLAANATSLNARVRVTNRTGHKLPTGYSEGRRMWLNVEARDAANNLIWTSGAYDDATGVLTQDAQLRTYEIQQGVWNAGNSQCEITNGLGEEVFHFVLNNCIRKDTRIPPLAFRGATDIEIRPIGISYPETRPGSGILVNYDDAPFAIPVPTGTPRPITVTAKLRYQIATREYITFLRDQAVDHNFPSENDLCAPDRAPLATGPRTQTRGQFMHDLWTNNGRSPPVTLNTGSAASTP